MAADIHSQPSLQLGVYRHYKGNEYEVIGLGKDTESEEWVVIYRPRYSSDVEYWVRPYVMFIDLVVQENGTVARFVKIS